MSESTIPTGRWDGFTIEERQTIYNALGGQEDEEPSSCAAGLRAELLRSVPTTNQAPEQRGAEVAEQLFRLYYLALCYSNTPETRARKAHIAELVAYQIREALEAERKAK